MITAPAVFNIPHIIFTKKKMQKCKHEKGKKKRTEKYNTKKNNPRHILKSSLNLRVKIAISAENPSYYFLRCFICLLFYEPNSCHKKMYPFACFFRFNHTILSFYSLYLLNVKKNHANTTLKRAWPRQRPVFKIISTRPQICLLPNGTRA